MPSIKQRLERLEKLVRDLGLHEPECICFPKKEPLHFHFQAEIEAAALLKCPIHGERFRRPGLVYTAGWVLEKRETVFMYRSKQFFKACYAQLPSELRPIKAKVTYHTAPGSGSDPVNPTITFTLKNGQEVTRPVNGTYFIEIPMRPEEKGGYSNVRAAGCTGAGSEAT